eukprot:GEZU01016995.1.p1 GENE.GEZU01016995.1~~GEZU01016995.1.p1  ORF type:complete len:148 (-),score=77.21 GEZU01016995.1:21-464(-)
MFSQEGLEEPNSEELLEMDMKIKELSDQVKQMIEENKTLQAEKKKLSASLSNEELDAANAKIRQEIEDMKAKLKRLKEDTVLVTPEEKAVVQKELDKFKNEWRKRKRMARTCIDMISEKTDQKPKVFMEEVGIETDEDVGVNIDKLH